MIIVPIKEGENIEKALKKFKRINSRRQEWYASCAAESSSRNLP